MVISRLFSPSGGLDGRHLPEGGLVAEMLCNIHQWRNEGGPRQSSQVET